MIDKGTMELSPAIIDEDALVRTEGPETRTITESFDNLKTRISKAKETHMDSMDSLKLNLTSGSPLYNGDFSKLEQVLLKKVENASNIERLNYLRSDARSTLPMLDTLASNLNDYNNGKRNKRINEKDMAARVKGGLTVDKIRDYEQWIKTVYIPAINQKAAALRSAKNESALTEAVGERHIFYRLSESEMFMMANRMAKINGEEVLNVIPRMVVSGQGFAQLTLNDLDSTVVYELFESNRYKITCRKDMKRLLQDGSVVMVYGDEYRIPTCIPYIIKAMPGNKVSVYVNITPFVSIDQYGKVRVTQIRNYSGLMALLFAACVAHSIARSNMSLPADVADALVLMYAGMMTKVINSLVHADSIQKETIRYLSAEFALVQMYGTEFGTSAFQRYKTKYFPKLGNLIVNSIDDTFHIDSFDNMTLFVEELKKNYPIMKGLSVAAISEKWMRSYGSATALSIDYFGFHIYTMCMLLFESPLISRMALEPLVDQKRGSDAFKRMQQMIENDK